MIIGAARDIIEHCGVPRFLFVDFPLGSACGAPRDVAMQRKIVRMALDLLESAEASRTTQQAPVAWPKGDAWKATVFTADQPFLSAAAVERWQQRKQRYRDQAAVDRE